MSFGNETFEYDEIGNPIIYRGKTVEWTKGRQMTNYNGISFAYDGFGRRTSKGNITYTYDSNNRVIKQSNGLEFIYDNSGVAGFTYNSATYLYQKDVLGNICKIIDSVGNVVVQYKYDAWGNHVVLDENGAEIVALNHIGHINQYRYRSYYFDNETNLYYLKSRYYDPETGRFTTIDDTSYLDPDTINGLNLYAYCGNNPVMRIDPNGNFPWLILALVLLFTPIGGAVVQATISTVSYVGMVAVAGVDYLINGINGSFYQDMSAIGWDPFNADENKVIKSNYFSFYKGVPVLQISGMGGSMSLGLIFFDKSQGPEVLKHERGHNTQLMSMGLGNYLIQIVIPSVWKNGDETPWELSASMLGGSVLVNGYSEEQKRKAYNYYIRACFPIINIYNIFEYIFY